MSEVQVTIFFIFFQIFYFCFSSVHFSNSYVFLQDEFSAVITKALVTLVHGLETKFDAEMAAMTRVPWGTLESVGDQSE